MFVKEWEGKFPKQYLDVIAKKCSNMNCGNYKAEGKEKCITCHYGKPESMPDIELAVVRKILVSGIDQHDKELLMAFDEEHDINTPNNNKQS